MNTSVLILAAGPEVRGWKHEHPKHLAIIEGKPLVLRTLEQLKERGYDDNVVVVTKHSAIKRVVPRHFEPASSRWRSETLLSTQELWADRTIVIHGDTIFSPAAMDFIVAEQGPLALISVGDRVHTEALVFTAEVQDKVRDAAIIATSMGDAGKVAPLPKRSSIPNKYHLGGRYMHWAFYRALSGLPIEKLTDRVFTKRIHRVLHQDYTCDIDSPQKYAAFRKRHKWA